MEQVVEHMTKLDGRHRTASITILSGTTWVLMTTGLGIGLNFLFTLGLARYLGADDFGLFAIGLAAFNIASVLATAGADSAALRYLPALVSHSLSGTFWPTVRLVLAYVFVVGLIFGGGLYAFRTVLADQVFHESRLTAVFAGFAAAVPLFALGTVLIAILQSLHIVGWRLAVRYICEPFAKVGVAVLLIWMGWGLAGALTGFVLALALTALLAFLPLRKYVTRANEPSAVSPRALIGFSLPLLLALVCSSIGNRSDILLLGYFAQPSTVGLYSAAFQAASVFALVVQSFESILQPVYSQRIAMADRTGLERDFQNMMRWIGMVVIPLFVVISLCGRPLLSLYGEEYTKGLSCLIALAFGQCFNSLSAPAHGLLVLAGYSRLVMWNSVIVALLQIGLNVVLIPDYGILGAAIATGLGLMLVNILRLIQVRRLLGIQPVDPWSWKIIAAAGIALAMVSLLRGWLEHVGLLTGAFAIVYLMALWIIGLHKEDQEVLLELAVKWRFRARASIGAQGV